MHMPLLRLSALACSAPLALAACGGASSQSPDQSTSQPSQSADETSTMSPDPGPGPGPGPHGGGGHGMHQGGGHQHHFDEPARYAERWNGPERDAWQQPADVIAALDIAPGMIVADLGTGTGYFLPYLADAVGEDGTVLGLDVEPAMVAWVEDAIATEGWTNVEAHQIGYDGPGVSDVDRFLIVNVWHHLEGRPAYATALSEALADGGRIVVVEYDMEAEPGPPMEMRLLPEQVIADFEAAGFDAELLPVTLPRQYMVVATPSE